VPEILITRLADRVVAWLRIRLDSGTQLGRVPIVLVLLNSGSGEFPVNQKHSQPRVEGDIGLIKRRRRDTVAGGKAGICCDDGVVGFR